jgi:hypothetical protein
LRALAARPDLYRTTTLVRLFALHAIHGILPVKLTFEGLPSRENKTFI